MTRRFDVVVVGSGPAGWATAAACAEAGLRCALIAPDPHAVWTNTYGAWVEDLARDVVLARRWDRVLVVGEHTHQVGRSYALIDNKALMASLAARFARGGGEVFESAVDAVDAVDAVAPGPAGAAHRRVAAAVVGLAGGGRIDADVVVDASGSGSVFVRRRSALRLRPPALQCAYGVVAELRGMPDPGAVTLMDWRGPDRRDPSFLYALDRGDGTWLVEETSLAHRPGLTQPELEHRLAERLRMLGAQIISTQSIERVRFVMDLPMPVVPQPVVGVGAAGSMVHPATGYSVAAALRAAPLIAGAVASGGGASAAWRAIWPRERVAARQLETYGLERLLTMDQRLSRMFFDTFFGMADADVATYLGGEAGAREMAGVMWRMFAAAPAPLRAALALGNPTRLARALIR